MVQSSKTSTGRFTRYASGGRGICSREIKCVYWLFFYRILCITPHKRAAILLIDRPLQLSEIEQAKNSVGVAPDSNFTDCSRESLHRQSRNFDFLGFILFCDRIHCRTSLQAVMQRHTLHNMPGCCCVLPKLLFFATYTKEVCSVLRWTKQQ